MCQERSQNSGEGMEKEIREVWRRRYKELGGWREEVI